MSESITMAVDYFRRHEDGAILMSTIKAKIIEAISPIFARFGVLFCLAKRQSTAAHIRRILVVSPYA